MNPTPLPMFCLDETVIIRVCKLPLPFHAKTAIVGRIVHLAAMQAISRGEFGFSLKARVLSHAVRLSEKEIELLKDLKMVSELFKNGIQFCNAC